ncbi:unnamed protein product, partial [Iphiclides podalirius]
MVQLVTLGASKAQRLSTCAAPALVSAEHFVLCSHLGVDRIHPSPYPGATLQREAGHDPLRRDQYSVIDSAPLTTRSKH